MSKAIITVRMTPLVMSKLLRQFRASLCSFMPLCRFREYQRHFRAMFLWGLETE